ncbi:hypothetical protein LTR09_009954 [Extremus antarcticus]|uniref:Uncharacterized protein n=1 Tax=Extremus antarcticus TaxID=702011 RepID=A0AAJ0G8R0_9PEZI|nr:hypothetical protein LTR09_009954 [Extremus antarcticus]
MAGPNLTLPDTIPEMEQYHDQPEQILPFALYTICELDDETLEDYRIKCATDCEDDMVRLPPQARFVGASLRQIVTSHLQLGRGGEFDPTYFIVCVHSDSTSVLVVTLDDDDLECKPGSLWIATEESGLLLVNLQIANSDWSEARESDLGGPTTPGEDEDDDSSGPDEDTDPSDRNTGRPRHAQKDDQQSEDYGTAPPLGFHIQVYTIPDLDHDSLVKKMEPMSSMKKADRSDWVCKVHQLPEDAVRDPTRYAADLHPSQCSKHSTLEKKFFIVADELNFAGEGVAIVHIDWDVKTAGRSDEQLLDFGRSLMFQVQRAEVPDNATRAAVATVCKLAQGYQKWQPKVKQFAIYYPNASDADIKLATAIDPRWSKRDHGEDRVALGGSMQAEEIEKGGGFWPALIRRHFAYCKRQNFVPSFVRPYLIYCGVEGPSADSEVQLIKLDWNGDLRSVDTLSEQYESKASVVDTPALKAHKLLTDVSDGTVEWQGVSLS